MINKNVKHTCLVLCSLLLSSVGWPADYHAWIALLPDTLNGLPRLTQPEGRTVTRQHATISTLNCRYASPTRSIALSIVDDESGLKINQQFGDEVMPPLRSPELMIETVSFAGYTGSIMQNHSAQESILYLYLRNTTLATLAIKPNVSDTQLFAIAKSIPWQKIAATLTK